MPLLLRQSLKAAVMLASSVLLLHSGQAPAQKASPTLTRPEIEKIVREYILQHPEVLMESVRQFQERERTSQRQKAKDAVQQHLAELTSDPATPVAGNADGTVTIVEFFDYRCGYCKQVAPTLAKLLASESKLRVVFKELPILGPDSIVAAKAGLAAHRQGAYLKFHQALMASTGPITPDAIERLALKLGLDPAKLKADMESPEVEALIENNRKLAEAIGVEATPAFVIGSEVVPGALSEAGFRTLIEAQKTAARPKAAAPK